MAHISFHASGPAVERLLHLTARKSFHTQTRTESFFKTSVKQGGTLTKQEQNGLILLRETCTLAQ